eukprot:scaffold24_cov341-Pavlova_lutheri.AAC.89
MGHFREKECPPFEPSPKNIRPHASSANHSGVDRGTHLESLQIERGQSFPRVERPRIGPTHSVSPDAHPVWVDGGMVLRRFTNHTMHEILFYKVAPVALQYLVTLPR